MPIPSKNQKTSLLPKIQPIAHKSTETTKQSSSLTPLSQMSMSGSSFSKHNAAAFAYSAGSRQKSAKNSWEGLLPKKKNKLLKAKIALPSCLLPSTTSCGVWCAFANTPMPFSKLN